MIVIMHKITPHDSVNQPFVLRRMKQGKLRVMEEYEDLVCKKCHKVDERAAFARGIPSDVAVNSRRSVLPSGDDFYLVNLRGRQVLSAVAPEEIDFIPIPSGDYFVAWPKVWIQPAQGDLGFRIVRGKCSECERPGEVVWGKAAPTIALPKLLAAVNLESALGARGIWLATDAVASELRILSPPLTGLVVVPKEVVGVGRGHL